MINDVDIGHAPILSMKPIIATADLSQAHRYSLAMIPAMSVGEKIKEARKERGMTQSDLGAAIGVGQSVISDMEAGKLKNWPLHSSKIIRVLGKPRAYFDPDDQYLADEPQSPTDPALSYVTIEVLPTFAGMGGGGTGDGDVRLAMLPRQLVEDELRAKASDLLMIDLRGNSMEPMFYHGDQVLIDKRDCNPVQPGAFALWDGDGYVVKNVERQGSKYRVFSTNPIYSDRLAAPDEVQIMGRPVWYARRL
jgi:phage repressor protein C with HTH and peptisase S24 domain